MSKSMKNLAHEWATQNFLSLAQARKDYEGMCIDFAGDCQAAIGGRIAYFETPKNPVWRYHAAIEIDGFIHDLWRDGPPIELVLFMEAIGSTQVEYPAEEEELRECPECGGDYPHKHSYE